MNEIINWLDQEIEKRKNMGRGGPNRVFWRTHSEMFSLEQVMDFAFSMSSGSVRIDWGVELSWIESNDYKAIILFIEASPRSTHIRSGALRSEFFIAAHERMQEGQFSYEQKQETIGSYRRLWSEEIAGHYGNSNKALQEMYYNYWPSEYNRLKREAQQNGYKLQYDMPFIR